LSKLGKIPEGGGLLEDAGASKAFIGESGLPGSEDAAGVACDDPKENKGMLALADVAWEVGVPEF